MDICAWDFCSAPGGRSPTRTLRRGRTDPRVALGWPQAVTPLRAATPPSGSRTPEPTAPAPQGRAPCSFSPSSAREHSMTQRRGGGPGLEWRPARGGPVLRKCAAASGAGAQRAESLSVGEEQGRELWPHCRGGVCGAPPTLTRGTQGQGGVLETRGEAALGPRQRKEEGIGHRPPAASPPDLVLFPALAGVREATDRHHSSKESFV